MLHSLYLLVLEKTNKHCTWFHLSSNQCGQVKLGYVIVSWMRNASGSDEKVSQTTYQVPALDITTKNITVDFKLDPCGTVGRPFFLCIEIANKTHLAQDFELKVIENEYFLLAGDKKTYFTTNPSTTFQLHYTFLPVVCGRVPLPRFDITATRLGIQLVKPTEERFIFVKPMVSDKLLVSPGAGIGMM